VASFLVRLVETRVLELPVEEARVSACGPAEVSGLTLLALLPGAPACWGGLPFVAPVGEAEVLFEAGWIEPGLPAGPRPTYAAKAKLAILMRAWMES
jgi:hypothetical protein